MQFLRYLRHYWTLIFSQTHFHYIHNVSKAGSKSIVHEDEVLDRVIDRSVLIVRPAEPFKRWIASMGGETVEQMQLEFSRDHTAYLIPEQHSLKIDSQLLKAIYANIFERELMSWHLDRTQWPQPRTQALFRQWFDLELCGMVVDMCDEADTYDPSNPSNEQHH